MVELLGAVIPFVAAGGWLWWIYQADRFDREPWRLVFGTFAAGAATGLVGLIAIFALLLLKADSNPAPVFLALVPFHVAAIAAVLYFVPYRRPDWNEPFDGMVYGGAAGIGYGLAYTLYTLIEAPAMGWRAAVFSIPVYMLAGLILGHFMSQVRFGPPARSVGNWVRGFVIAGLYVGGIEAAQYFGGHVMGSANLVASSVVYAANTFGWVLAMHAMDAHARGSQFHPGNYRLRLAGSACPHCGAAHIREAAFCTGCGQPAATAAREVSQ